jgi:outer membrane protein TolC
VTALPAAPPPQDDAAVRAAAESPEVASSRAAVASAEARVAAARLDLRPAFSVGAGAGYRGAMDPVITARFGVELPIWRRKKQLPMLRAAEQELEMSRRELADAEAMARAAGARLLAEWRNADEQVRRYRDGILPQADSAFDAARSSYLAGRGDFSTLVEDFDLWLDARVGLARREADRFAATAAYRRLTGAPAPASPGPPASRSEP